MSQVQRELISRVAMFVLSAILIVAGAAVLYAVTHGALAYKFHSHRDAKVAWSVLLFGFGLVFAGVLLAVMGLLPSKKMEGVWLWIKNLEDIWS